MNRQFQREAQQRRRELERQAKEVAKLSALEQARLEVETFENSLDVLLSVHREPREQWDWNAIASDLNPPAPRLETQYERSAWREALTAFPRDSHNIHTAIEQARIADRQAFRDALEKHAKAVAEIQTFRELAERVLEREGLAFLEAFAQFNPVAEFSAAGSLRKFAVEGPDLVDCAFKVSLDDTIPDEVRTLTATGKLSVKPMPQRRRHELYQDYVSACSLRMANEIMGMLPVETVIVTAFADIIAADASSEAIEMPILSITFDRNALEEIDFETASPMEVIERFPHRCNFKATRGSARFQPVIPLTAEEAMPPSNDRPGLDRLLALARELQDEIRPAAVIARAIAGRSEGDT